MNGEESRRDRRRSWGWLGGHVAWAVATRRQSPLLRSLFASLRSHRIASNLFQSFRSLSLSSIGSNLFDLSRSLRSLRSLPIASISRFGLFDSLRISSDRASFASNRACVRRTTKHNHRTAVGTTSSVSRISKSASFPKPSACVTSRREESRRHHDTTTGGPTRRRAAVRHDLFGRLRRLTPLRDDEIHPSATRDDSKQTNGRNTTQPNPTQPNPTQHSTAQRNTAQPNPTQHSTAQHSTAQHNPTPTQPNPTQHTTPRHPPYSRSSRHIPARAPSRCARARARRSRSP